MIPRCPYCHNRECPKVSATPFWIECPASLGFSGVAKPVAVKVPDLGICHECGDECHPRFDHCDGCVESYNHD